MTFLFLLFAIGVYLLFEAVQRLFLGHQIQIDSGRLLLQDQLFGFIPLRKQLWPISSIEQFLVIGEEEMEEDNNNINFVVFHLAFQQQQAEEPTLLISGINDHNTAFFLERTLERALQIKDKFVPGEYVPYADLLHLGLIQKGYKAFRWLRWLRWLN